MWCEPTPSWKKPTGSLLILGTLKFILPFNHLPASQIPRCVLRLLALERRSNKAVFFRLRSLKWHGD